MNFHGFGMYLFIGVSVLFISTALSQKPPNTSQNAPANSSVTPAIVPRKADPIEQRDATTPMPKQPMVWKQHGPAAPAAKPVARAPVIPQKVANQMAKPPTFARGPARIAPPARRPIIPRDPIVHARPVAQETKQVPREPIVHARTTTPEPKEVEVEGTTSYYYDYYNNYNNQYDAFYHRMMLYDGLADRRGR
uniref:Protein app1-like n=1 Tax=Crassostrea virginica TaxID=6565 RepID=A0A8B8DIN3_CRAVI|nr:protein app1-like [Crassostrea virginica]